MQPYQSSLASVILGADLGKLARPGTRAIPWCRSRDWGCVS